MIVGHCETKNIHSRKNVELQHDWTAHTKLGRRDTFPLCDLGREMGGRLEWLLRHAPPRPTGPLSIAMERETAVALDIPLVVSCSRCVEHGISPTLESP